MPKGRLLALSLLLDFQQYQRTLFLSRVFVYSLTCRHAIVVPVARPFAPLSAVKLPDQPFLLSGVVLSLSLLKVLSLDDLAQFGSIKA